MQRKSLIILLALLFSWFAYPALSKPKLSILLSNDDGYNAPGIEILAKELSSFANIFVAAPLLHQSGAGHSITYREPIFVKEMERNDHIPWYSVSAKPATCVRLAIEELMKTKPDLVISGINSEPNLGLTTYYSGTLGAAREAAINGLPAIAISTDAKNNTVYKEAAKYTSKLVKQLEEDGLIKPGLFLNVNIPGNITNEIKGVEVTWLSNSSLIINFDKRTSPSMQTYYWSSYEIAKDKIADTDINAFRNGFITLTPLSLDQTNAASLEAYDFLKD